MSGTTGTWGSSTGTGSTSGTGAGPTPSSDTEHNSGGGWGGWGNWKKHKKKPPGLHQHFGGASGAPVTPATTGTDVGSGGTTIGGSSSSSGETHFGTGFESGAGGSKGSGAGGTWGVSTPEASPPPPRHHHTHIGDGGGISSTMSTGATMPAPGGTTPAANGSETSSGLKSGDGELPPGALLHEASSSAISTLGSPLFIGIVVGGSVAFVAIAAAVIAARRWWARMSAPRPVAIHSMSLYANQAPAAMGAINRGGGAAPPSWDNKWDDEDNAGNDGWDNDSATWEDVEGGAGRGGRGSGGRGGGRGRGAGGAPGAKKPGKSYLDDW
ncbi:hypothetical protein GPECTOR_6g833 [Gonium pectorale]|uniref:Uncharacterized protein n=1 Tax=Gonium pectorale TaxID=33097 RepID=A0A150GVR6_GONPE|nr:hypothetical protein GPECTOR_6g833 [Gonium pectorale]|eukprot:KXZ53915.1 hypothetical protein GPECTOR_6g833 [Gonium pectorale]